MTKHKKNYRTDNYPFYPGAATPRYFKEKVLEVSAAIASSMGCVTVLLFFLLL